MRTLWSIYKRELHGYFTTPMAYVFLVIFLFYASFETFRGGFFEMRQATMHMFFTKMPLLLVFLVPAIAMRLWAEEMKSNSVELLFTLPVTAAQAVVAKYLAALTVLAIAIVLTLPMVFTVCYLGDPDWGVIVAGYFGCFLLSAVYLAIGGFFSGLTRNQVIAFVLGVMGCMAYLYAGNAAVLGFVSSIFPADLTVILEYHSIQSRFESLLRGVIEIRDVVFFVFTALFWLVGTVIVVRIRTSMLRIEPALRAVAGIACIAVIVVCSVMLTGKILGRSGLDLTQYNLYTLSEGTRNIVGKLPTKVDLRLYYSRTAATKGPEGIRFYNNYFMYVRDLLQEYEDISGGKISLEVFDPRQYSEEEDKAIEDGIKRLRISEEESFFFGLAVYSELGKKEVIEFFEPGRLEFVEYDISKLLLDVTRRELKKIGVIASLPIAPEEVSPYMRQMLAYQGKSPEQPWTIVAELRNAYEVVSLPEDTGRIDESIDYLMVVHPKDLPGKTLFAIDQYVMRGGKLMVFIDPFCIVDEPVQDPSNPYAAYTYQRSSELNVLLEKWGVRMDSERLAADKALALSSYPIYLGLNEECVDKEEVITSELHSIKFLFAGALKTVEGAPVVVTPLLTTTSTGTTWKPDSPFAVLQSKPEEISRRIVPGKEPVMLACRITGRFETNYPDGPPEDEESESAEENGPEEGDSPGIEEGEGDTEPVEPLLAVSDTAIVLVFSDVDFISDRQAYERVFFQNIPSGDNAALVFNSLDYLGGSTDLISIRSRGEFDRPFDVVDRIEKEAEQATADEMAAYNAKKEQKEKELKELAATSGDNRELLQSEAVKKRAELQEEIRIAEKEMRKLNAGKRERIEKLKMWLQIHNMLWAPLAILLIAVVLAAMRYITAKRSILRRAE